MGLLQIYNFPKYVDDEAVTIHTIQDPPIRQLEYRMILSYYSSTAATTFLRRSALVHVYRPPFRLPRGNAMSQARGQFVLSAFSHWLEGASKPKPSDPLKSSSMLRRDTVVAARLLTHVLRRRYSGERVQATSGSSNVWKQQSKIIRTTFC